MFLNNKKMLQTTAAQLNCRCA